MTKFKAFFAPIYPWIYQNSYKGYSKPAENVKSIHLSDGLRFKTKDSVSGHARSKKGKKCGQPKPLVPKDIAPPGSEYIMDKCGFYHVPKTNSKKWKTISLILLPIVVAWSAFIFRDGVQTHAKHEFIPYEYMYIRNKRFPWGDGKQSLFHGRNNFIPEVEKTNSDNKEQ